MFDYYASLGFNCEGAFQIRRVLGRDESNFFSWNVTSFEAAISLIGSRFTGIMQPENFAYHADGGLVYDRSHDYYFHSDFPRDPSIVFSDYPQVIENHRSKAAYLVNKFMTVAKTTDAVAYFYKTEEPEAQAKAVRLASLLADIGHRGAFHLIVLQDVARKEEDWGIPNISNRYMTRLAPFYDATDGHVLSWDRVFAEFPHRDGLRLAGF